MDSSKLGVGEAIAGVSGLLLFIFMFLPWYGIDAVEGLAINGGNATAWEAFSLIDIVLFLLAVVVVALVLAQLAGATPKLLRPSAEIVMIMGVIALVLILFRLILTPNVDTAGLNLDIDLGRKVGIFLALLAAGGIAYGGWRGAVDVASGDGRPSSDS